MSQSVYSYTAGRNILLSILVSYWAGSRVLAGISTALGFRLWARKREDIRKLRYYDVSMNLCGTTFHCSYTSLVIVFGS